MKKQIGVDRAAALSEIVLRLFDIREIADLIDQIGDEQLCVFYSCVCTRALEIAAGRK